MNCFPPSGIIMVDDIENKLDIKISMEYGQQGNLHCTEHHEFS